MNKTISPATDDSFEQDVIQSTRPVLVYFWATWSQDCQSMPESIEAVAAEKGDRLKTVGLDIDSNPATATLHRIRKVPTVILFIAGKEQARIEGFADQADLSRTVRHI